MSYSPEEQGLKEAIAESIAATLNRFHEVDDARPLIICEAIEAVFDVWHDRAFHDAAARLLSSTDYEPTDDESEF